jgi:hypothetical protein
MSCATKSASVGVQRPLAFPEHSTQPVVPVACVQGLSEDGWQQ